MKNILNLLKTSYRFKRQLHKCSKYPKDSEERAIADYYHNYFEVLEDEGANLANLESLKNKCREQQQQHRDSAEIQYLLANTLELIEALKVVVASEAS